MSQYKGLKCVLLNGEGIKSKSREFGIIMAQGYP